MALSPVATVFRRFILGLSALSLLAGASGCKKAEKASQGMPERAVTAGEAVTKDVPLYIDSLGRCTAYEAVNVVPQVDGPILSTHFKQGAYVKKGDLLFTIDPRPYEGRLEQAKGQLTQDLAQLKIAELQVERSRDLLTGNYVSKQDFDSYVAKADQARGQVVADRGNLEVAAVNLERTRVTAPIDGKAGIYLVNVGNVVSAAANPVLTTIQRTDRLYVDFPIADAHLATVQQYLAASNGNLPIVLTDLNDPTRQSNGTVSVLGNAVQTTTGTVQIRGDVDNASSTFWPNQPVSVRLVLKTLKDAVLVPAQAPRLGPSGHYVFVVKDGAVEQRVVKLGQNQADGLIVVSEGVKAGEQVVVTGQIFLRTGSKVTVVPSGAQAATSGASAPSSEKPAAASK